MVGQLSVPKFNNPESSSLSENPKDFSITEKSLKLLEDIIIPYANSEPSELAVEE